MGEQRKPDTDHHATFDPRGRRQGGRQRADADECLHPIGSQQRPEIIEADQLGDRTDHDRTEDGVGQLFEQRCERKGQEHKGTGDGAGPRTGGPRQLVERAAAERATDRERTRDRSGEVGDTLADHLTVGVPTLATLSGEGPSDRRRFGEPDQGDNERWKCEIAGAIPREVERQRDEAAIEFADGRSVVVG